MSAQKTEKSRPFAVVTGGSTGIGLALAHEFAEHGFDLLVVAENDEIHAAAQDLQKHGAKVEALQVDLATYEGVEETYRRIQAHGDVDALALNAGVGVGGKFIENDLKEELNLIALNVISPVHLAKRVVKDMAARGKGRVLFTSSVASQMPGPYYAAYAASKSFLQSFSIAIREELKETGVTVTALLPGATETPFFERAHMEHTKAGEAKKDDPREVARQGFAALMAGKDQVVGGSFMNKVQVTAAMILPDTVKAELQGQQTKPKETGTA